MVCGADFKSKRESPNQTDFRYPGSGSVNDNDFVGDWLQEIQKEVMDSMGSLGA